MRRSLRAVVLVGWALGACSQEPVPLRPSLEAEGSVPREAGGPDPAAVCRADMAREKASDIGRTFWPDCPRALRSPDGRWELFTKGRSEPMTIYFRERRADGPGETGKRVVDVDFPNEISWAPSSDGFFLNDSEGSGQSSYFRYFEIRGGRVVEHEAARKAAVALYKRLFKCASPREYVYTRAESWSVRGDLVGLKVWASHHSDGCALDPFSGNELQIVIDPRTGRIFEDVGRLRERYFGETPSTAG